MPKLEKNQSFNPEKLGSLHKANFLQPSTPPLTDLKAFSDESSQNFEISTDKSRKFLNFDCFQQELNCLQQELEESKREKNDFYEVGIKIDKLKNKIASRSQKVVFESYEATKILNNLIPSIQKPLDKEENYTKQSQLIG